METPESEKKDFPPMRSEMQGLAIFAAGLAIIAGLNYVTISAGVAEGSRSNIDVGSPLSLLEFVLIPAIFILLIRVAWLWCRYKPIGGTVNVIIVLLIPQILFMWFGALVYGSAKTHSTRSREMATMRTIAVALDSYQTTFATFPKSFGQAFPGGAAGGSKYVVWSCGPELTAAISKLPTMSDWLVDRVYDPTNGTASAGDIFRTH